MLQIVPDVQIAQWCDDLYCDPPAGDWAHIWPAKFGYCGHKQVGGIDYLIRRGSKDPFDWWVDLDFTPQLSPGIGYCHGGFLGDVLLTWDRVSATLGPHSVLGGHSLGAGTTAIEGAMLAHFGRPPLRMVLMGCPRPFFQQGADELVHVPVPNYASPGDPVMTVPPWTIVWPYVDAAARIPLTDHTDPADHGLFRAHHCPVYIAGLGDIPAARSPTTVG